MSGFFCRHPVLAKFTALAVFVCLHGCRPTEEPKKKHLGVHKVFWVCSDVLHSTVDCVKKNPGKIGFFGDLPCLVLLLVGVPRKLRL